MRAVILLSLAALLQPSPAFAAKEPINLKPSSSWQMAYDDEGCRLSRQFGEGRQKVVIHFSRYDYSDRMDVVATSRLFAPTGSPLKVRFAPGEQPEILGSALFGKNDEGTTWQFGSSIIPTAKLESYEGTASVLGSTITPTAASEKARESQSTARPLNSDQHKRERIAEVTHFEISGGVRTPVTLELGSLVKPMEAMETCMDDLVRTWGFDPAEQRAATSAKPKNSPARWISPEDYPISLSIAGVSGSVQLRLDVSAEGRPTKCVLLNSLSDPAFKARICKLLMGRAEFKPAQNAAGQPIATFWSAAVVFAGR